MSELVYRQPCEHGAIGVICVYNNVGCPGGVEVVLDPDYWFRDDFGKRVLNVADVLAVLEREET